jgi:hypothetical protein
MGHDPPLRLEPQVRGHFDPASRLSQWGKKSASRYEDLMINIAHKHLGECIFPVRFGHEERLQMYQRQRMVILRVAKIRMSQSQSPSFDLIETRKV